jgi:FkbM family methyltransferase
MSLKPISHAIRIFEDAIRISGESGMRYSVRERLNLFRARTTRGLEAQVLDYKVKYLNRGSFRIALWEIFFKGEYRFTARTETPVILDCGANIGLATLFFKHLYPQAHVTAFEADPNIADILKANITNNNLRDVEIQNLMLANTEGDRTFFVTNDPAANLMGSANPNRVSDHREVTVPAARLSRFIHGPVDFLKLDVEGSEFEVLEDLIASGSLSQIASMVIEYHHKIGNAPSRLSSFLSTLEDHGYEYQIGAIGCDPITLQDVYQDITIGAYRRGDVSKTT